MKTILYTNPVFTPAAANSGTLNFSTTNNFQVNRLLAVIDQTQNTLIYATSAPNLGYSNFSGTTLTLQANTTGYSSTDSLICIYDYAGATNYIHDETSASTITPVQVKSTSGILYGVCIAPNKVDTGTGVYSAYLKIYNNASPTVGTTIPELTICLCDNSGVTPATPIIPTNGLVFQNGISYVITANAPYTDTTLAQSGHSITINYI
jgi:hypothetical protein